MLANFLDPKTGEAPKTSLII